MLDVRQGEWNGLVVRQMIEQPSPSNFLPLAIEDMVMRAAVAPIETYNLIMESGKLGNWRFVLNHEVHDSAALGIQAHPHPFSL